MKDIYIIWVQWSWKWTQVKLLLEKYWNKFSCFESWVILRALKSSDNALWNCINKTINDGNLVSWKFIWWLFESYIYSLEEWTYMLVDSIARNWDQMWVIAEKMKLRWDNYIVLFLDLDYDAAVKRLSGRRICNQCWEVLNILNDPEIKFCKKCGWELIIRHDDAPEIISRRMQIFYEETMPIVDHFAKLWKVLRIDAGKSVEEVFENIVRIIESN